LFWSRMIPYSLRLGSSRASARQLLATCSIATGNSTSSTTVTSGALATLESSTRGDVLESSRNIVFGKRKFSSISLEGAPPPPPADDRQRTSCGDGWSEGKELGKDFEVGGGAAKQVARKFREPLQKFQPNVLESAPEVVKGWFEFQTYHGRRYYYEVSRGRSQWRHPLTGEMDTIIDGKTQLNKIIHSEDKLESRAIRFAKKFAGV